MNPNSRDTPDSRPQERTAPGLYEAYFLEGFHNYEKFLAASKSYLRSKQQNKKKLAFVIAFRTVAIAKFRKALEFCERNSETVKKIEPLLLIAKLTDVEEEREECFYEAVELAKTVFGKDLWETKYGKRIASDYLAYMNGGESKNAQGFMQKFIIAESGKREYEKKWKQIQSLEEEADEDTEEKSGDILNKLKRLSSEIKIQIITEESDEVVFSYGCLENEDSASVIQLLVNIFGKPKRYLVSIDKGGVDIPLVNIKPILTKLIKAAERERFRIQYYGYLLRLNKMEADTYTGIYGFETRSSMKNYDYRSFIALAAEQCSDGGELQKIQEDPQYVENLIKAINICRIVILTYPKEKMINPPAMLEEVREILGGEMNRTVLGYVKTMILSYTEVMSGSSYPFGLTQNYIPFAGRLYSVIRAFESPHYDGVANEEILTLVSQWAENGCLDKSIVQVFLKCPPQFNRALNEPKKEVCEDPVLFTSKLLYQIQYWFEMLRMARVIGDNLSIVRGNTNPYNRNLKLAETTKLKTHLQRLANIEKIYVIFRHGLTKSDLEKTLGTDDECLTPQGISESQEKGKYLVGLYFDIISGMLPRVRETAEIIQQVSRGVGKVIYEKILKNPLKNDENERLESILSRLTEDDPALLKNFTKSNITSPQNEMKVFVTHRDTAKNFMAWLESLSAGRSHLLLGEREIENDAVYEVCIRGGKVISMKKNGEEVLEGAQPTFFSLFTWKKVVEQLNAFSKMAFGKIFYDYQRQRTELSLLQNKLFDFLDKQDLENRLKFIDLLKSDKTTEYLVPLLTQEESDVSGP